MRGKRKRGLEGCQQEGFCSWHLTEGKAVSICRSNKANHNGPVTRYFVAYPCVGSDGKEQVRFAPRSCYGIDQMYEEMLPPERKTDMRLLNDGLSHGDGDD